MAAMRTRITELPNQLTSSIDAADAVGIVRLLRQSDAQLFVGWGAQPSISDGRILERINRVANKAAMLLNENHLHGTKNAIVFSGSGTSGRIAWLCSRAYNRLLCQAGREPCFHYLISGGDESLIISNELPEDDPPLGAKDLQSLTTGVQEVMFFGITCGLSAPYVAGQVDYAMHQPNYTTVLVGFNPVALARDTPIEKWHKTCRDTFLELEQLSRKSDRAVILNPVVGPEPITGSTRMKGGSMTAVLLDTIFITALSRAFRIPLEQFIRVAAPAAGIDSLTNCDHSVRGDVLQVNTCEDIKVDESQDGESKFQHSLSKEYQDVAGIVDTFAAVYHSAYRPAEGVAALLSLAASCLRYPDGHLYYIGASTFGILGLIDSSEMVDTYGAALDEVRGFVVGGWKTCANQEGDICDKGRLFRISTSHFEADLLSNLASHDAVICLSSLEEDSQLQAIMEKVLSTPAKCGLLVLSGQNNSRDAQTEHFCNILDRRYQTTVFVSLPYFKVCGKEPLFGGFALKLIVNAISTGANVLKGRVYGNTMINLTVANDKLFHRSVDIISELSGAAEGEARAALLRAIYRDDDAEKYEAQPVSSHIRVATQQNMVIPLAVVLASGKSRTVADALALITSAHSLRTIIKP